jgi:hypothetical protein
MARKASLQYSSIFKAFHLDVDSASIQVDEQAWIEKSTEYINTPSISYPSFLDSSDDPQFGLRRFYADLRASPVRLRTAHNDQELEEHPFAVHDCSHLGIAVSILCDPWFVVGIETFFNDRELNNPSFGLYTSFFTGENASDPACIHTEDEDHLKTIYSFVHRNLAFTSWDGGTAKLLLLFLRCVVRTPYQRFTVLKLGLDHLFTEWDATILNAALFLEYLLTNESDNPITGVQVWNSVMPPTAKLNEKEVDIIFRYRHLVAHSNPTRAKHRIETWMKEQKIANDEAILAVRRSIWMNAKKCIRAIIDDENKYYEFLGKKNSIE